ncbi:biotin-independent malonate decarboxylase subunit gamma [Beijerinckia sp. L45]|uniref:biotin-independent malonate decarboxylase subunit gamma n=1 Tax=Beijerinckia sp. L45 TaxID=1641855 RepID=UPI00131C2773|nr:biotin-independent malonate decarboxylase subunit gamma [Beijerinckia sp. L45]
MTLDDLIASMFPAGHAVKRGLRSTVHGAGRLEDGTEVALIGIVDRTPLTIDAAIEVAGYVLSVIEKGGTTPILVLVDTASQNMARRDELLGLNEYLAHLSKCLTLAALEGHRTIGILYGHAAAGALIATALSTQVLVALPDAEPSVMDLPSISRVTKLPLDKLTELAKSTPVFAPGLEPLFAVGAVTVRWDATKPLAAQLLTVLQAPLAQHDPRDAIGLERKGRLLAAPIAARVAMEANAHG